MQKTERMLIIIALIVLLLAVVVVVLIVQARKRRRRIQLSDEAIDKTSREIRQLTEELERKGISV